MRHFLVFGRQPWLSEAEAESVLNGKKTELFGEMAVFDTEDWKGASLQDQLGGTVKLGDIAWEGSIRELNGGLIADWIERHPRSRRILFGLTSYGGTDEERKRTEMLPIELKRELQSRGKSVRWVTGEEGAASPSAVEKLRLTTEGYDLCIGIRGERAAVGVTTHVQNATAWSERDYGRPFRDAKAGMLPPKLARMMVNLALGNADPKRRQKTLTLLDPFCGSGTILMEAALLGVDRLIGSDIDGRQIAGAKRNMDWLAERGAIPPQLRQRIRLVASPAEQIDKHVTSADFIVTEGYLGKPLRGEEDRDFLRNQKREIETIWRNALPIFANVQPAGGKLVMVWPEYLGGKDAESCAVDLADELPRFGYRLKRPPLPYARPDQRVKRWIVVAEKTDEPARR